MTNYTKTTDFAAKDSLPSGDSGKIIRGSEFETEFDNIATAVNSKSDANNPTFTGTVTIDGLTVNGNTVLGNAATDTVTVTADIASNLLPSADDTYNLGAVGAEWNDLHVDGVAYIDTIAGFATTENITFGDNDKAIFGASSDLQIYHDGSNSRIDDAGTGNLIIRAADQLYLGKYTGETYFQGSADGPVRLFYNGVEKLETTSTGIDVTGVITTDGMTTSADINFGDNDKANFGASNDLRIYHDGSNSYISDSGTGNLNILVNDLRVRNTTNNENMILVNQDGDVQLAHDGLTKLATTSTGIDVTGTVTADGLTSQAGANATNILSLSGGAVGRTLTVQSYDTTLGGAGFDINATASAGELTLQTNTKDRLRIASNGDVSLFEDTGTTAKFFWDSSAEALGIGNTSFNAALHVERAHNYSSTNFEDSPHLTISNGSPTNHTSVLMFQSSGSDVANKRSGITGGNYHSNKHGLAFLGDLSGKDRSADPDMFINSTGKVGIGTSSPASALHVQGSVQGGDQAIIESTNGGAANGPQLNLKRSSATPADNDPIGMLKFTGNNSALAEHEFARIAAVMNDVTNATEDGSLLFSTSSAGSISEAMRIDSSRHLIVPNGVTLGTAVGTYAAANTLDDYEEGTWIPTLTDGTTTVTQTNKLGSYVKVGNIVSIFFQILDASVSGLTGSVKIGGLPFTTGNTRGNGVIQFNNVTDGNEYFAQKSGSNPFLELKKSSTTTSETAGPLPVGNFSEGVSDLFGSVTYII